MLGLLTVTALLLQRAVSLSSPASLLEADALPSDPNLVPAVGNGYIATIAFSDTVYISGVYNGEATQGPSHRARIPSFGNIAFNSSLENVDRYSLDLERGWFSKFSTLNDGAIELEQRVFAHRQFRSLLVNRLKFKKVTKSKSFTLDGLFINQGSPSQDIKFYEVTSGIPQGSKAYYGMTTIEEIGGQSGFIKVAVCTTAIPSSFTIRSLTKYSSLNVITAFRSSLDSKNPLTDACQDWQAATSQPIQKLVESHLRTYRDLISDRGIEIAGDSAEILKLSQVVNTSFYYLLTSIRDDWDWSLSPGGLASNSYNGHVFWDAETWMYPGLLLFYPELAASMIRYRDNHRAGARLKAQSYPEVYKGTMYPWESAYSGQETCPPSAATGVQEQHITADVGMSLLQYWRMTNDAKWLNSTGIPMLIEICEFWASRVTKVEDGNGNYHYSIEGVIPPDEYHENCTDSVYTNVAAGTVLNDTVLLLQSMGASSSADLPLDTWSDIGKNIRILFDDQLQIHPEFEGYTGDKIKQADAILLGFPLEYAMDNQVRKNDLDYYMPRTDYNGPAMTWGLGMVNLLEITSADSQIYGYFNQSYANAQGPFWVWYESPSGGAVNFITGVGGFLQTLPFGWGGMRIREGKLQFNPNLPQSSDLTADSIKLRGIRYQGAKFDVMWTAAKVEVTLISSRVSEGLSINTDTNIQILSMHDPKVVFPRQGFSLSVTQIV